MGKKEKKLKKSVWASILLIVICTLFSTTGQYFWKTASKSVNSPLSFALNGYVWLGFICYAIGSLFLLVGLRNLHLSIAYPVLASSYIWIILWGYFFLNETFYFSKGLGISIIIVGIIFLGIGGDKK